MADSRPTAIINTPLRARYMSTARLRATQRRDINPSAKRVRVRSCRRLRR